MNIRTWIWRIVSPLFIIALLLVYIMDVRLIDSPNPLRQTLGGAYANLFVSVGTVFLAIVTFLASRDARRSIRAQETSVERMRDNLRPLLDMDVFYQTSPNPVGMFLTVRNVGVGPATIRLFTGRNDISTDCFHKPVSQWKPEENTVESNSRGQVPITNMVLGPSEAKVLFLGSNSEFSIHDGTWVSSLSVFYEDVYGRYYRARIIYKRDKNTAQVIGKESFGLSESSLVPWKLNDIQDFRAPEGTPYAVPHRFATVPLHLLHYVDGIKKRPIPGIGFTGNEPIRIINLTFDRLDSGFPRWEIKVGRHKTFKLRRVDFGDDARPPAFSLEPTNSAFSDFGLISLGGENDLDKLRDLYMYILKSVTTGD